MANIRTVVISLTLLVLAVLASAPRASADVSEVFYVSGTFTNLLRQTETLTSSSSVLVDLTTGTILSADLVVPGATFTGIRPISSTRIPGHTRNPSPCMRLRSIFLRSL